MAFRSARSARSSIARRLRIAGALGGVVLFAGTVAAQPDGTASLLIRIPRLAQLVINGDVSSLLTLPADGTAETSFDTGYVQSVSDATSLTLNTNDVWDLSARLGGTWTCPGTYDKAESDLLIRITNGPAGTIQNGASGFIGLTGVDLVILSHDAAVTDNQVDIQTRVLLDWEKDIPGSYSIDVTYTLVTHLP